MLHTVGKRVRHRAGPFSFVKAHGDLCVINEIRASRQQRVARPASEFDSRQGAHKEFTTNVFDAGHKTQIILAICR